MESLPRLSGNKAYCAGMAALNGASPGGLSAAARAIADALAANSRSLASGTDMAAAVDLAALLTLLPVPEEIAAHPLVVLASDDAVKLANALGTRADSGNSSVEGVLARRFLETGRAAAELVRQASLTSARDPQVESLAAVARAYQRDAADERDAARTARLAGGAIVGVGLVAAAFVGVGISGDGAGLAGSGRLIAVAGLFVVAALMFRSAASHERASREYVRLERGMAAIEPYLAPLPEAARHFLRATLTQSLFPLLPEDDDPLRQPQWPTSRDLLWASYQTEAPPDDEEAAGREVAEVTGEERPGDGQPQGS